MGITDRAREASLSGQADRLAQVMYEIAHWSKSHPNSKKYALSLFNLPPVFTDSKHGDPKTNLVAIIKTLDDYEQSGLRLSDLPARYNQHGGQPKLASKDVRRVHNWLHQISFGIRAAVMEQEIRQCDQPDVPERVMRRLYASSPNRVFVACSPDNRNEYRPLRYAANDAKLRWLRQEYEQRKNKDTGIPYGASLDAVEWEIYGLRGQLRTAKAAIEAEIENIVMAAKELDETGHYAEADDLGRRLAAMSHSLERWNG